jgi:endonuclease/exonuclease/phosphatase family metal-dependent hydrolase
MPNNHTPYRVPGRFWRRLQLLLTALSFPILPAFTAAAESEQAWDGKLRVVAYNILVARGWPGDRELAQAAAAQGQIPERLVRELALYDPDIINFSESPTAEVTMWMAAQLGMQHVRFPSGGNWPGTLLSRFPIVESANVPLADGRPDDLFTRHWGRAVLRLPDGTDLVVHSAHLYPHAQNTAIRVREISAMLDSMRADRAAGRSMLLMGDLNHVPDSVEHAMWLQAGWVDSFLAAGRGDGYTSRADVPARRIDYILAAGPVAATITEARALFAGAFRTNPDDPRSFALSDHLPHFAVFDLRAETGK